MHSLWADLIVVGHFLYICFTVGSAVLILLGAFLKWRWIRNQVFRVIHLIAVLIVAFEAIFGAICPLTEWEYNFREMAGQSVERDIPFLARLIRTIIFYNFPLWVFTAMYIGFAGLVIITLIFIPPKRNRKKDAHSQSLC